MLYKIGELTINHSISDYLSLIIEREDKSLSKMLGTIRFRKGILRLRDENYVILFQLNHVIKEGKEYREDKKLFFSHFLVS